MAGYDNVFAIGDIAQMATAAYPEGHPQVAQPAIQQGRQLGENIRHLLQKQPLKPFGYDDKGTMATIGRASAVAEIKGVPKLKGFIAWAIWIFIHVMTFLGNRNRFATIVNLSARYLTWPRTHNAIVGETPMTVLRTPERAGDAAEDGEEQEPVKGSWIG